ncbi:MAG: hypothetical protein SF029_13850 [bacterium]|nr:hypothetical protein [bacterium]
MGVPREHLGLLFALVGPGGVGKNTLMNRVLGRIENLSQLPTATTRPMRPNEQQGREHLFVTGEEFQHLIDTKSLLEYQEVRPGQFYGMPRSAIEAAIQARVDLIADIEVYGATILRNAYPENAVLIFVAPTAMQRLIDHMRERNENQDMIRDRMKRAEMEMTYAPTCDYFIVNDQLDQATEELYDIVSAEQNRITRTSASAKPVFRVSLTPTHSSEILRRTNNDFAASLPLEVLLREREMPQTAALRLIQNTFGILPSEDALDYATLDGSNPVEIEFDSDEQTYSLTYHFLYRLPERLTAPEGLAWMALSHDPA